MKQKRYAEEQIPFALRQHEAGTSVPDIVRRTLWKATEHQPPFAVGFFHARFNNSTDFCVEY